MQSDIETMRNECKGLSFVPVSLLRKARIELKELPWSRRAILLCCEQFRRWVLEHDLQPSSRAASGWPKSSCKSGLPENRRELEAWIHVRWCEVKASKVRLSSAYAASQIKIKSPESKFALKKSASNVRIDQNEQVDLVEMPSVARSSKEEEEGGECKASIESHFDALKPNPSCADRRLREAAKHGDIQCILELVRGGANVNARDDTYSGGGATALHIATLYSATFVNHTNSIVTGSGTRIKPTNKSLDRDTATADAERDAALLNISSDELMFVAGRGRNAWPREGESTGDALGVDTADTDLIIAKGSGLLSPLSISTKTNIPGSASESNDVDLLAQSVTIAGIALPNNEKKTSVRPTKPRRHRLGARIGTRRSAFLLLSSDVEVTVLRLRDGKRVHNFDCLDKQGLRGISTELDIDEVGLLRAIKSAAEQHFNRDLILSQKTEDLHEVETDNTRVPVLRLAIKVPAKYVDPNRKGTCLQQTFGNYGMKSDARQSLNNYSEVSRHMEEYKDEFLLVSIAADLTAMITNEIAEKSNALLAPNNFMSFAEAASVIGTKTGIPIDPTWLLGKALGEGRSAYPLSRLSGTAVRVDMRGVVRTPLKISTDDTLISQKSKRSGGKLWCLSVIEGDGQKQFIDADGDVKIDSLTVQASLLSTNGIDILNITPRSYTSDTAIAMGVDEEWLREQAWRIVGNFKRSKNVEKNFALEGWPGKCAEHPFPWRPVGRRFHGLDVTKNRNSWGVSRKYQQTIVERTKAWGRLRSRVEDENEISGALVYYSTDSLYNKPLPVPSFLLRKSRKLHRENQKLTAVRVLLKLGAKLLPDDLGWTPLHIAAYSGKFGAVKVILQHLRQQREVSLPPNRGAEERRDVIGSCQVKNEDGYSALDLVLKRIRKIGQPSSRAEKNMAIALSLIRNELQAAAIAEDNEQVSTDSATSLSA